MANTNAPFGFRPIIRLGGAPFSITEYGKPASDANALYAFDVVKKVTGKVLLPEAALSYYLPTIQTGYQGTPGTTLWVGASLSYGAASVLTVHPVCDEVDCVFISQCKTGTTIATDTHVGRNANLSTTTAGSTTTKMSGLAIDGATINTTSSLDFRILKLSTIAPNAEGDSAILEVVINKHFFGQQTAGV